MSIGDLVKIREGVEDEQIPENRMGIIIKTHSDDTQVVKLSNGNMLQFSPHWIIVINEAAKKITATQA